MIEWQFRVIERQFRYIKAGCRGPAENAAQPGTPCITSSRLVPGIEELPHEPVLPDALRTDNRPEFLGEVLTAWY